jgi:hypothetical protein
VESFTTAEGIKVTYFPVDPMIYAIFKIPIDPTYSRIIILLATLATVCLINAWVEGKAEKKRSRDD